LSVIFSHFSVFSESTALFWAKCGRNTYLIVSHKV